MEDENTQSDTDLMRELQEGRDGALSELIARWREPLFSFAYRYVQNAADADEVGQETFVRVYQHRHRFRLDARFSTWLFAIAANLCRNRARWRRRHATVSLDGPCNSEDEGMSGRWTEDVDAQTPEDSAARKERAVAVREAVSKLPHDLKTALLLFQYEGLSHQEIADVLKCSPKAVETRIYRARRRLKKKLDWLMREEAGIRKPVPQGRVTR